MNNSNALAEIQSKYPNCNLLLPAATSVQILSLIHIYQDSLERLETDIFPDGKSAG